MQNGDIDFACSGFKNSTPAGVSVFNARDYIPSGNYSSIPAVISNFIWS